MNLFAHIVEKNQCLPAAGHEIRMKTEASQRPTDILGGNFEHLSATAEYGVDVLGQITNRKILARSGVASSENDLQDDAGNREVRSTRISVSSGFNNGTICDWS